MTDGCDRSNRPSNVMIQATAFGRVLRDHWRTDFVDVYDGGDAFWGVLFDPAALRFFSPRFNGVA